jgi:hypothetical protein
MKARSPQSGPGAIMPGTKNMKKWMKPDGIK